MSTLFPDAPRTRFLELTNEEWVILFLGSLVVVAWLSMARDDVGLWPALGIGFTIWNDVSVNLYFNLERRLSPQQPDTGPGISWTKHLGARKSWRKAPFRINYRLQP